MQKISVIVPIYHGKKYVPAIITQIQICAALAGQDSSVELILVNDAPDEKIGEYFSENVHIKVLETDVNRGIHGARVYGLFHTSGEYIVFLDQDDIIAPEYLHSQLESIGNADAVVCRLTHAGKQFYNHSFPFEDIINFEFTLRKGTPMISPGQVLIRKEAIPEYWKNNIVKNNGADDWFLWLCMMKEGKQFALNQNIVFDHVVDGSNASFNTLKMHRSEKEILEKLKHHPLMTEEDIQVFEQTVQNMLERYLVWTEKYQTISVLYDRWMILKERNIRLSGSLKKQGIARVAIYGVCDMGKRLYEELIADGVEVCYYLDRNGSFLDEVIPVYELKENLELVDVVIISLVQHEKEIMEDLKHIGYSNVVTVLDLLKETERRNQVD